MTQRTAHTKEEHCLIINDNRGRREFLLTEEKYILGRSANCDIIIKSQFVSRHHARPLIPPQCPLALAQLIRRCWHPDPSCRPSAAFASIVLQRLLEEGLRLWKEVGRGKKRQERRGAKMKKSRTVAI